MKNLIKAGTVFAGNKTPDIHNEITKVYMENGRMMVDVDQYGATLETMKHERKVTFYMHEITYMLKRSNQKYGAHIILVR